MAIKEDFTIIPFKEYRFAIADKDGKILDDAQGWGYKTRQKAYLALNYKFLGGREKGVKAKQDYKMWLKQDEKHREIIKRFNDLMESYFKEIARNERTVKDVWDEIVGEFGIEVPSYVKTESLK